MLEVIPKERERLKALQNELNNIKLREKELQEKNKLYIQRIDQAEDNKENFLIPRKNVISNNIEGTKSEITTINEQIERIHNEVAGLKKNIRVVPQ
ncbi:hypothetical protein C2W62_26450 [Candidatus Entotheonella serta]|nr:hypothetical protein C2W62_26450 [Candidatus Entotheonella serta]